MLSPRWPGALAHALVFITALGAARVSATITPSNTSTVNTRYFQGTLPLQGPGNGQQIAELIPLTREGAQRSIEGNLYLTNDSSVSNISDGEIAYISCNPTDYSDFLGAQGVFDQAYGQGNANISGVILYSTVTDYCDFEDDMSAMSGFPVLSMTNKTDSLAVLNQIDDLAVHMKYFVQVEARGTSNTNNGNSQQPNPLGPSPSTAVAMIILYSITGIITALFLVIILTGAIRAHRNPERYGPRNVMGRPRQSRAKGLGRAILETIPIIKFGEKEEPAKPGDVELGSTSGNSNTDVPSTTTATTEVPPAKTTTATVTATKAQTQEISETPQQTTPVTEQPEGIAAAIAPTAVASGSTDGTSNHDALGCTICTEDFEKGQDIRVLPCDHKFHPECVDPWLLNVSGTCPLCRVDLRPTKTNESSSSQQPDELAPPLNPETGGEAEGSHHRRTGLRDILFFRSHPDASAEERISALRRLREQRRNQSGEVAGSSADGLTRPDRRSRRLSSRMHDVFAPWTRRGYSPENPGRDGT
ncbi:hypothetical protein B5807_00686 [Epicoccum nigrum]|jgi:hypothetical protein|uniref:RING-type domain-containing protein n=1 Tax=Epicoccum nigrum TaxID=105696 RepID=A0A1Y2MGK0_EPING|nr:hypothetical protein B5807_00686 [Epicoccum nigrum]